MHRDTLTQQCLVSRVPLGHIASAWLLMFIDFVFSMSFDVAHVDLREVYSLHGYEPPLSQSNAIQATSLQTLDRIERCQARKSV